MTEERDPWDAHWFEEPYLALYPERDDREARAQAVFARELLASYARAGRVRFLEIGCGTLRRTGTLADGLGAAAGMDPSVRLLVAGRPREPRLRPGPFCGLAQRLPLASRTVGAAVSFAACFGLTDDAKDDDRVAREVARILAPGGAFLSAAFNAERLVTGLVRREEKTIAGARVVIRRRYDPARRMLEKEIEIGSGEGQRVYARRARALTEHELRARLRAAGLTVVNAWGGFDGSPFDRRRSGRLLLLATKPSSKAFGGAR